jgi:hypothetical protein
VTGTPKVKISNKMIEDAFNDLSVDETSDRKNFRKMMMSSGKKKNNDISRSHEMQSPIEIFKDVMKSMKMVIDIQNS